MPASVRCTLHLLLIFSGIAIDSLRHSLPGYTPIAALTDEFDGDALDTSKWTPRSPGWPGRKPGLFDPSNVVVGDGMLQLWARAARRNDSWPEGYDNYTTAAVHSLARVREGYFEIRWRSGDSGISSSWWLHHNSGGNEWTEIDVFETTGVDNEGGFARASRLPTHVHVFALPGVQPSDLSSTCNCTCSNDECSPCSIADTYDLPAEHTFAEDFHVASLNWTGTGVEISIDGVVVNQIASRCLIQEIGMDFDRETMPGWMSLPDPMMLPDRPFEIDYVRAWRRVAPEDENTVVSTHYGDPTNGAGCLDDEGGGGASNVFGVAGFVCAPHCNATGGCPTDVPSGVQAAPECWPIGKAYCALVCDPSSDSRQCGDNLLMTCKEKIPGVGICTYDD